MIRVVGKSKVAQLTSDFDAGPSPRVLDVPASLLAMTQEWVLFTYAPLFLYGRLHHNPVQEYINEANISRDVVALLPLDVPLFGDLPQPWASLLWACKKEHWKGLSLHIGSLGLLDRDERTLTRVVYQEFQAPDIIARRTGKLQNFQLSAFGADCSHGYYLFLPAEDTLGLPRLVALGPEPTTVALASTLLEGEIASHDTFAALLGGGSNAQDQG